MVATAEQTEFQAICNPAVSGDSLLSLTGDQRSIEATVKKIRKRLRGGLSMGSLPAGCEHIAKDINQLRAKVEGLVAVALRGAGVDVDYETFPNRTGEAMIVVRRMPFLELNWINTYCKWERHARFVQKRLSEEAGNMTAAEQLAYSREIATASSNRDKWLEKLGLQPAKAKDVWDLIVATRQDAALIHQPPKAVMDGQLTTEGNGADSRPDLDLQTATDLRDANP